MSKENPTCVVSGSFDKFKPEIDETIDHFRDLGVEVLAPEKGWLYLPSLHRRQGFRPLKSEINKSIKQIEDEYLDSLSKSNFFYLVDVGGYVGEVSSFEMGYALRLEKPVYAREPISKILDFNDYSLETLAQIKVLPPEQVIVDFGILSRK